MVGAVIGNYKIIRKLGEGGMGAVYLGQHALLGRKAAVKVLLPSLSARPDIVNRFFNEARAATSINDPGIVQIFDFGFHTDSSAYIVMEFLEGETLDARLHKLGRLPLADALRICRQVAGSLAAAHAQHIVHRDLKPENIFLVRDPEVAHGERPKILDFGIAKLSDDNPGKIKTHAGALMGTPVYMSPEQCRGAGDLDHRSDIYALGCVLFHLLAGRPPFDGEGMGEILAAHLREPAPPPSSRAPGIPPEVDAIVLRCLAKAPAERFADMTELATAIGQVLPYLTAPGAPGSYPPPYQAGATPPPGSRPPGSQPPNAALGWARTSPSTADGATPHHGTPPPSPTPTTLGSSAGQLGGAAPRRRSPWLLIAAITIAAGGGAAIAIGVGGGARRGDGGSGAAATAPALDPHAAATDAGAAATGPAAIAPAPPDAGPAAIAPPALDAGPAAIAPPALDAGPAAPPDAAPPPPGHHGHRHPSAVPPGAATPPGCDRSIDFDCDGIPDIR